VFDPGRFERGCFGVGGGVSIVLALVVVLVDKDLYVVEMVVAVDDDDKGNRTFLVSELIRVEVESNMMGEFRGWR
jgi:hypothetical protein